MDVSALPRGDVLSNPPPTSPEGVAETPVLRSASHRRRTSTPSRQPGRQCRSNLSTERTPTAAASAPAPRDRGTFGNEYGREELSTKQKTYLQPPLRRASETPVKERKSPAKSRRPFPQWREPVHDGERHFC